MRSRAVAVALAALLVVGGGLVLVLAGGDGDASEERPPPPGSSSADDTGPPAGGGPGAPADAAARGVRLRSVGRFDEPLYVTAPPGDRRRVFVVEKEGRIRVLLGGKRLGRPFLDLSGQVSTGGEQGLLSMAFAPDYARSGRFYVDYTDRRGDTRVDEFRRSGDPNRANAATRRPVLFVDQPYENHNGGLLLFGPDRLLYVGLGDGGAGGDPENRAQSLDSLLGKILRIDPRQSGSKRYRSPVSNPFVGRSGRNEIYSYGLRNPWRFSFDRTRGDLYIGDVGQGRLEEIDFARRGGARGRNYGWSCFEGRSRFDSSRGCPAPAFPILQYGRASGECSVTGGVVVRDPNLRQVAGRYLYGDFCRGQVRSFRVGGGRASGDRPLGVRRVPSLSSFGEDARGRVYLTSLEGRVYRLASR